MKTSRASLVQWVLLGSLVSCGLIFAPVQAAAQKGDNGVWTLNGINPVLAPSSAWVDASTFCNTGGTNCKGSSFDFCLIVSQALTQLKTASPAGGVVDARGVLQVPDGSPPTEDCTSNPFVPLQRSISGSMNCWRRRSSMSLWRSGARSSMRTNMVVRR
jgi:hypothetical protein